MRLLGFMLAILMMSVAAGAPVLVDVDPGHYAAPALPVSPDGAPSAAAPQAAGSSGPALPALPAQPRPNAPALTGEASSSQAPARVPLDPADATPWTPSDPMQALAYQLATAADGPEVEAALHEHMRQLGYPLPPTTPPEPPSDPHFDANDTLAFTYNLGDADGDQHDDVAINAFCVVFGCFFAGGFDPLQSTPPLDPEGPADCGWPQQIYARSGRTGELLWDIDLSRESLVLDIERTDAIWQYILCPVHIVMGTIPVGPQTMDLEGALPPTGARNSSALLVYTIGGIVGAFGVLPTVTGNPTHIYLQHQVYALDAATGARLWTHTEEGQVVMWDGCGVNPYRICSEFGSGGTGAPGGDRHNSKIVRAQNLLVNPLVMVPKPSGVQVHSEAAPTLMLQGVGFEYDVVTVWGWTPGQTRGWRVIDDYRPDEWAGALDLNEGTLKWTARTFTPDQAQSVVPNILNAITPGLPFTFFTGYKYEARVADPWSFVYGSGVAHEVDVAAQNHWRHQLCCFDITGDQVPDRVYTTQEWNPRPIMNSAGPYYIDSRVVAFDGSDGSPLWDVVVAEDLPRFIQGEYETLDAYAARLEIVGDTTGDGKDDVLLHKFVLAEDFVHEAEILNGTDGTLQWGVRSAQHKIVLPLGDTDGDGASDVAMFDWFEWDFPVYKAYDLANVTAHPIKVRSGVDGQLLWQTQTFNAPLDLFYILDGYKVSGLHDYNGDGVVDFCVDDPTMLPDQTVIHKLAFLDGRTGKAFFTRHVAGTFAFPIWGGDQSMDGIDDFFVFSGEIGDIWLTNYDGATGVAQYSQRFMTLNANDYTLAVPRIGILGLDSERGQAALVNYQMRILRYGGYIYSESTYAQIRALDPVGARAWNYPEIERPDLYVPVVGASPASALFDEALAEQAESKLASLYKENDRVIWKGFAPSALAFALASLGGFALSNVARRRRRRRTAGGAEW